MDKLYRFFDKKSDNFVKYLEFISLVRGDLSQKRADLIAATWNKISPDNMNAIKFDLLQSLFDPNAQHDVIKISL